MSKLNPVVHGRMYKVSDGGSIKGVKFNKNGTVQVLVVPGKKRNPRKKKRNKAKAKRIHRKAKRNCKPRTRRNPERTWAIYKKEGSGYEWRLIGGGFPTKQDAQHELARMRRPSDKRFGRLWKIKAIRTNRAPYSIGNSARARSKSNRKRTWRKAAKTRR